MRAWIFGMCGIALFFGAARHTFGTVIAEDDFTYPDGALSGQNGGTGAWFNQWVNNGLDVVSGQVVTNAFANPPKYVWRVYTDAAATNEVFVKFTMTLPSSFTTADYFGLDLTSGVNTTVLSVGKLGDHNNFRMTGVFDTGIPITPGQTYNIVVAITYPHGAVPQMQLLWIDPDASDYYDPVTGNSSADAVGFQGALPRAATVTLYGSLAGVKFDNLVLCDNIQGAIPPACPGDVNGDGFTNVADFNILASHFGQAVPPNTNGDLTGDGFVNVADFNILAGDFGCP